VDLEPAYIAIAIVAAAFIIPRLLPKKKPDVRPGFVPEQTPYTRAHYGFVYNVLPAVVYKMPRVAHAITEDERARAVWTDPEKGPVFVVWRKMLAEAKASGAAPTVELVERPWGHVILVTMPEPTQIPLAYFVAIVPRGPEEVEYFTLEKSLEGSTVLGGVGAGEWRHLNYGGGPPPEREAFIEAVGRLIERRS
jgi:hypothetical protein